MTNDLRARFETGSLLEVSVLRGSTDQAIFVDEKGHAGQIFKDLGALVWIGSIYGVDVYDYSFERDYTTDLGGMAQTIVSEDDYTLQP